MGEEKKKLRGSLEFLAHLVASQASSTFNTLFEKKLAYLRIELLVKGWKGNRYESMCEEEIDFKVR